MNIPWGRYALISELARRYEANGVVLRKTALQKMVFMLQRVFGLDCDYSYTLYTYGPYSSDLSQDLDVVEGLDGVQVSYVPAFGGYEIRAAARAGDLISRAEPFIDKVSPALNQLVNDYGRATAKELELRSTILYFSSGEKTPEQVGLAVHRVKPHFNMEQIRAAQTELAERNYVSRGISRTYSA